MLILLNIEGIYLKLSSNSLEDFSIYLIIASNLLEDILIY